jgi:hypothetical protein
MKVAPSYCSVTWTYAPSVEVFTNHVLVTNAATLETVVNTQVVAVTNQVAVPPRLGPFWGSQGLFWRYPPDFAIGLFNQLLFLALVLSVFLLARRLFDPAVATLAAVLLLGSELYWRFSLSGLSTMLVLLLFMGLTWCLVCFEEECREPRGGPGRLFVLAGVAGLAVGVGALTRYSFGWLLLPVLLFVLLCAPNRRAGLALTALGAFALLLLPWVWRNYHLSGTLFGTAGYALYEGNHAMFPEFRLQRSLEPNLAHWVLVPWQKLLFNLGQVLQNDLPRLGGTWVSAFFLAGLLVPFNKPAVRRLRYFLLASLLVLTVVQALGRTQLSEESPELNSENVLVLAAPLVLLYGLSLFFLLLEQVQMRAVELPLVQLRQLCVGAFCFVVSLPLFLALASRTSPVVLDAPAIQDAARWVRSDEVVMTDIPWAMAWYGDRQSVWLTLHAAPDLRDLLPQSEAARPPAREDFFAIHDYQKPLQALYLTSPTLKHLDSWSLMPWYRTGEQNWGGLLYQSLPYLPRRAADFPVTLNLRVFHATPEEGAVTVSGRNQPQGAFPLRYWQRGWPSQFLLTARERPPG